MWRHLGRVFRRTPAVLLLASPKLSSDDSKSKYAPESIHPASLSTSHSATQASSSSSASPPSPQLPKVGYFETPLSIPEIAQFYDLKEASPRFERPYIWTMTISSIDGRMSFAEPGNVSGEALAKVLGPDKGEGGAKDWKLLNAGWAQADAVLGSGQELRDEGHTVWTPQHEDLKAWRKQLGKPKHPLQVIVTKSGDIPVTHPIFHGGVELRAVVYTSPEGKQLIEENIKKSGVKPNLTIHAHPSKDLGELLTYLLAHLRTFYKINHLDVTAGSIILGQLYALRVVDEIRLTICGQLIGSVTTAGKPRPSIFNIAPHQTGRLPPGPLPPQIEFTDVRASDRHLFFRGRVLKDAQTRSEEIVPR